MGDLALTSGGKNEQERLLFEISHFHHLSGEGQSFIACGKGIPAIADATVALGNDGHDLSKQNNPCMGDHAAFSKKYKKSTALKFPWHS